MSYRIIATLLIALSSSLAWAQGKVVEPRVVPALADNAPERHVVVPGDTLWSIAARFLKDPTRWPEVWRLNPGEIRNPHRIYPGQVIVLERGGPGEAPRLVLLEEKLQPRIREEARSQSIPAIPQQAIEPFLSRPLVVDDATLQTAPRIVAVQNNSALAGPGDRIYVTGVTGKDVTEFLIYHPSRTLVDPDSKEVLGQEARVIGSARLLEPGDPAILRITSAQTEITAQDRLFPRTRPDIISYPQRRPDKPIAGRVLSLSGEVRTGGRLQVVSLSRGSRDGLEVGHVLTVFHPGDAIVDRYQGKARDMGLPDEAVGLVYVFQVFERVSYALIMEASRPVEPGDRVRNP